MNTAGTRAGAVAPKTTRVLGTIDDSFTKWEREVMRAFGFLDEQGRILGRERVAPQVPRKRVTSLDALNEAYDYELPSSFSRGLSVDWRVGQRILWLSGTASLNDAGESIYPRDFRAQTWRTFWNLTRLIESEGGTWHDLVRTSCYLRDIDRDYDEFNKVRTLFFRCMDIDPVPASTGIQAKLCRPELLIEIEAIVLLNDADKNA
jgi:enamine deaminase RidA (YjgF/YER057c/UK114 family)